MKNWKTTIAGLIIGAVQLLQTFGVISSSSKLLAALGPIGVVILGYFAKDKNVTGGNVSQDGTPDSILSSRFD